MIDCIVARPADAGTLAALRGEPLVDEVIEASGPLGATATLKALAGEVDAP